jgi:NAD-dependent SIR2 family protein deacetylase
LNLPAPELLFDSDFFDIDPEPFYKFAHILLPNADTKPSFSHKFIQALEQNNMLLRLYSQNIDNLESVAGITNVVQCHGSMSKFRCVKCNRKQDLNSDLSDDIANGRVAFCSRCSNVLKPCITFFGDTVPSSFKKSLEKDIKQGDFILLHFDFYPCFKFVAFPFSSFYSCILVYRAL